MLVLAVGVAVGVSALAIAHAQQQRANPAPAGTASLGGVVVVQEPNGDRPLRRVTVRLGGSGVTIGLTAVTDDNGRFLFSNLPASRFTLMAAKPGFPNTFYGAAPGAVESGRQITLEAGQQELGLRIVMARGAVIAGTVRDTLGQPMASMYVQFARRAMVAGRVTKEYVRTGGSSLIRTDDRGQYRAFGLPAGEYVVFVSPRGGGPDSAARMTTEAELRWAQQQAQQPAGLPYTSPPPASPNVLMSDVYFPGTTDAAAAIPVKVEAGEERLGTDITVVYVTVSRVAGVVTRPDGSPATGTVMYLVPESGGTEGSGDLLRNRANVNPRGEFSFDGVQAGNYILMAQASSQAGGAGPPSGPPDLHARQPLRVHGADITGVSVALQPGLEIRGRMIVDAATTSTPPSFESARVSLSAPPGAGVMLSAAPAVVAKDGTFTLQGVAPGTYLVNSGFTFDGGVRGWIVKSILFGGRDYLDRPLELSAGLSGAELTITVTDRAGELSGRLIDQKGQGVSDHPVILFTVDRSFWLAGQSRQPRSTRPSPDGTFRFSNLLAGDFYIAVGTPQFLMNDLRDPAFLEQLVAAAVKLTIGDGEKKVQDLKIAR